VLVLYGRWHNRVKQEINSITSMQCLFSMTPLRWLIQDKQEINSITSMQCLFSMTPLPAER